MYSCNCSDGAESDAQCGGISCQYTLSTAILEAKLSDADLELHSEGTVTSFHPRILTRLQGARLRLSFLIRCRNLKRPPPSLRMKACKLIDKLTAISVCSKAESSILEGAILSQQLEIKKLDEVVSYSDPNKLDAVNFRQKKNLQAALDKKFSKLVSQDNEDWKDWPSKIKLKPKQQEPKMKARDHFLSVKRSRNIVKRQRRASNLLKKVAMDNIASGSVLNLSEKVIPPEVISVLSKGKGFVVNSSFNSLETRTDCQTTLAKLSTTTQFKIKELKEHMKNISYEKHDEKIEDDDLVPDFPKSLKRQKAKVPQDSGDKVVGALKKDIMVDIEYRLIETQTPEIQFVQGGKTGSKVDHP